MRIAQSVLTTAFELPFFVLSLLLIGAIVLMRLPVSVDIFGTLSLVAFSMYVFVVPMALVRLARRSDRFAWLEEAPATVLCLFAFFLAGYFGRHVGGVLLLGASGYLLFRARQPEPKSDVSWPAFVGYQLALFAVLAPFFIFVASGWAVDHLHLYFDELLTSSRSGLSQINRDILAQISYATMLDNYGVFAAGVHGLHPLKFQFGGHLITAAFDRMVGRPPAFFYNFAVLSVIFPALLQAIYRLLVSLSGVRSYAGRLLTLTLMACFVLKLVYQPRLDQVGFYYLDTLTNVPSIFGYWFLFVYLGSLFRLSYFQSLAMGPRPKGRAQRVFDVLLLPLFLGWVCFAKCTLAIAGAAAFGVYWAFEVLRHPRKAPYLELLTSATATLLVLLGTKQERGVFFTEDYYVSTYAKTSLLEFFKYFYFDFLILCAAVAPLGVLAVLGSRLGGRFPRRFVDLFPRFTLIALAVTVLGAPSNHFSISGASGVGFTMISSWISWVTVVLLFLTVLIGLPARFTMPLGIVAAAAALACAAPNSYFYYVRIRNHVGWIVPDQLERFEDAARGVGGDHPAINYVRAMRVLRDTTDKKTMIYIDRNEGNFWGGFGRQNIFACQIAPLLAVTQAGRPLVFGINRIEDACYHDEEGMFLPQDYPLFPIRELPPSMICKEVRRYAFARYVSLIWNDKRGDVDTITTDCTDA